MIQSLYLALFWTLYIYPIHLPYFVKNLLKPQNTTLHTSHTLNPSSANLQDSYLHYKQYWIQ